VGDLVRRDELEQRAAVGVSDRGGADLDRRELEVGEVLVHHADVGRRVCPGVDETRGPAGALRGDDLGRRALVVPLEGAIPRLRADGSTRR
jgi:hypothetical protein